MKMQACNLKIGPPTDVMSGATLHVRYYHLVYVL